MLHGFVIKYMQLKIDFRIFTTPQLKLKYALCVTVLVTVILSANKVRKILAYIIYILPSKVYCFYNKLDSNIFSGKHKHEEVIVLGEDIEQINRD